MFDCGTYANVENVLYISETDFNVIIIFVCFLMYIKIFTHVYMRIIIKILKRVVSITNTLVVKSYRVAIVTYTLHRHFFV